MYKVLCSDNTLFTLLKLQAMLSSAAEAVSVVGVASDYGLDGPGIESRWERDFPFLSKPTLGPTQPPVQWKTSLFWW
jgi:hypothetical protein